MYNRWYQYLTENKILYPKQLGFQTLDWTWYRTIDQILESFFNTINMLWVFLST